MLLIRGVTQPCFQYNVFLVFSNCFFFNVRCLFYVILSTTTIIYLVGLLLWQLLLRFQNLPQLHFNHTHSNLFVFHLTLDNFIFLYALPSYDILLPDMFWFYSRLLIFLLVYSTGILLFFAFHNFYTFCFPLIYFRHICFLLIVAGPLFA